jgi:NADH:ubiquinone oxidoreductase subunit 2 (subunit N)
MLFILFAAWLASWIDLNSGDQTMLTRSMLILALGFAFLLSIFPFISWISMVGEGNHPFLAGYLFNTYFIGVMLFGLRFILEGGWFGTGVEIQLPLQLAGMIMLGFGGILAALTRHLGRLMGALVIAEIGRALLAVSLFQAGFPIYFGLVIIQSISLGLWSLSLTYLSEGIENLDLSSAAGVARIWPEITAGLLLGYFSLAGLPLLGGFPIYWALGSGLSYYPLWINVVFVTSTLGLILGGLRVLGTVTQNAGEESVLLLGRQFYRYLIVGISGFLIILGFFPQLVLGITQLIANILMGI